MLRDHFSISVSVARAIALLMFLVVAAVAARSAEAQTYTVLHAFGGGTDGAVPGPVISDEEGTLYGATYAGGIVSCGEDTCGTVFKVDSAGNETILYRFEGGNNGYGPFAGLARDARGTLYGTTQGNGVVGGAAVVFKVDSDGNEITYDIAGANACCFDSPVAVDAEGNIYGMSPYGGKPNCNLVNGGLGCGTLFKITPSGKFKVLHVFKGQDGIQPEGGVVLDAQGNIYGVAAYGGKLKCEYPGWGREAEEGCGTIYKLEPSGRFTILHTFTGPGDGSDPMGLIIDSAGNLYGIADAGGDTIKKTNWEYGLGTVFKVDTSGKFSVLYTFQPCTNPPCSDGKVRNSLYASHLARDSEGNLYGIEEVNNCAYAGGCIFKVDTKGKITDLYNFTQNQSGAPAFFLSMGLVLGSDDDFYGSTPIGGSAQPECSDNGFTQGCGSVFHLVP